MAERLPSTIAPSSKADIFKFHISFKFFARIENHKQMIHICFLFICLTIADQLSLVEHLLLQASHSMQGPGGSWRA